MTKFHFCNNLCCNFCPEVNKGYARHKHVTIKDRSDEKKLKTTINVPPLPLLQAAIMNKAEPNVIRA